MANAIIILIDAALAAGAIALAWHGYRNRGPSGPCPQRPTPIILTSPFRRRGHGRTRRRQRCP